MSDVMSRDEYTAWWIALPDDTSKLPDPIRTLAEHVMALQGRIDNLPDEQRCCCAYDHPQMVCMVHAPRTAVTGPVADEVDPNVHDNADTGCDCRVSCMSDASDAKWPT